MRYSRLAVSAFLGLSLLSVNCSLPPSARTLSESTKKLKKICKEEYNLDVVLSQTANTLWIYVPMEETFINLKATEDGPQEAQPPSESRQIFFLDTKFDNGSFRIRYDIGKAKKSAESPGYGLEYSQKFKDAQRHLLTAIAQSFGDVERPKDGAGLFARVAGDIDYVGEEKNSRHKQLVHSYVQTERVPDFFVVVLADIKTGLETKMYFYLDDFLRSLADPLFTEEYSLRALNEGATGKLDIVGDKAGQHLKIYDMTWPEFLAKQIKHRIQFKYTQSDFKPDDNSETTMLTIVAQATQAYNFKNFTDVELINLGQETRRVVTRQQVDLYLPQK
jgi:hypothetical protein